MTPKIKIIKVYPETRSVDVHYYTDELLTFAKNKWAQLEAEELSKNPDLDLLWFRDWVLRTHPAGGITHITFYQDPIPIGNDLKDFLINQLNYEWLKIKHNALTQVTDMSSLENIKNEEISVSLNTNGVSLMLPVKVIGVN